MGFLIFIIMGALAGLIAGNLVKGKGFGLLANIVIGVIGSMVGKVIFDLAGLSANGGFIGQLVVATVGAVAVLLIANLVRGK